MPLEDATLDEMAHKHGGTRSYSQVHTLNLCTLETKAKKSIDSLASCWANIQHKNAHHLMKCHLPTAVLNLVEWHLVSHYF